MKRVSKIKRTERPRITPAAGSIFEDLGFPDAAELKAKVRLCVAINRVIDGRRLSQSSAAKRIGISQPKVSALRNYRLDGFSVERLMKFLNTLGCDVDIVVRSRAKNRRTARTRVVAA